MVVRYMLNAVISLFTVFLYISLGAYVLKKNPHERTNHVFAILMLAFIIWSLGTYNINITDGGTSFLAEVKVLLSGAVIALTLYAAVMLSLTQKNPLAYLIAAPSLYILYLIWTSGISDPDPGILYRGTKQEFFLLSTIFGIAGIYLLLRHYMTSKYRQREQAKIIVAGAISAALVAVFANIILPMFFDVYLFSLSTLAPAVMGLFFAYAAYQYGLFVRAMPELSATSFCSAGYCTLCSEYLEERCSGCKFGRAREKNCEIYRCVLERGYSGCRDCPEIFACMKRKEISEQCFVSKPKYELEQGRTFLVRHDHLSYQLFLDAVRHGALGLVATTAPPLQVMAKYDITTTPILWISENAVDRDIKPRDLERLGTVLANFMKKNGGIVLLDGIDELIAINGFDNVQRFLITLNSAANTTNSRLVVPTGMEEILKWLRDTDHVRLDTI